MNAHCLRASLSGGANAYCAESFGLTRHTSGADLHLSTVILITG